MQKENFCIIEDYIDNLENIPKPNVPTYIQDSDDEDFGSIRVDIKDQEDYSSSIISSLTSIFDYFFF